MILPAAYRNTTIAITAVVAFTATMYGFWLPSAMYADYQSYIEPMTDSVRAGFAKQMVVVNTVGQSDADASATIRFDQLRQQNAELRDKLQRLSTAAEQLPPPLPGMMYAGDYKKAAVTRDQARQLVRQSGGALRDYQAVLAFLETYQTMRSQLDHEFEPWLHLQGQHTTIDGRYTELDQTARRLEESARKLRSVSVPSDFAQIKDEAVVTFTQAVQAFDSVAYGSYLGSTDEIQAGLGKLRTLSRKNQSDDARLLRVLVKKSPTLRSIYSLSRATPEDDVPYSTGSSLLSGSMGSVSSAPT